MKLLVAVFIFLFNYLPGETIHQCCVPLEKPAHIGFSEEKQKTGLQFLPAENSILNSSLRSFDFTQKSQQGIFNISQVFINTIYRLHETIPDFQLREEEDDENIIKTHVRKYYALFSDIFFPVDFGCSLDRTLVVPRNSCEISCKYILQRVLRI